MHRNRWYWSEQKCTRSNPHVAEIQDPRNRLNDIKLSEEIEETSCTQGFGLMVNEVGENHEVSGLATGILLAIILGLSFPSFAKCFTNDSQVLDIVRSGLLFVSASQPLNALAYIFDGLHYGVSDFPYAAISMMIVGALASIFLLYAPPIIGLPGVWSGLTIFMGLRSVAGFMRLSAKNGPWWFLQDSQQNEIIPAEVDSFLRSNIGSLLQLSKFTRCQWLSGRATTAASVTAG
ncbi:hypothetical protein FXO38_00748 [Capsicum annuum]|nr:hypothetical protein FXO38_00748 [Capsicum annuum]KAF3685299.1 hypothetical protein FXO37_00760 [Capsicum annuum]